jgi:hypothetical protein
MHRFHALDRGATATDAANPEWVLTARPVQPLFLPTPAERRHRFRRDGDHIVPDPEGSDGVVCDLVPVSRFVGVPPGSRPDAFCPVCRASVVTKCGEVLRPHYAHRGESSSCATSTPESALHQNAKVWIAQQLQSGGRLRVRRTCGGLPQGRRTRACDAAETSDWIAGWDEAEMEFSLPSVRADILLLKQGVPIAAIEVHGTHLVDAAKVEALRALGIPWVEVEAADVFGDRPWTLADPLPVRRSDREAPLPWRCSFHERLYAEKRAEVARQGDLGSAEWRWSIGWSRWAVSPAGGCYARPGCGYLRCARPWRGSQRRCGFATRTRAGT